MRTSTILLCGVACVLTVACNRANRTDTTTSVSNTDANVSASQPTTTAQLRLTEAPVPKAGGCPVQTREWVAFVQSVHGKRILAAGGSVHQSSGGWKFNFKAGALDKAAPPTQHFTLEATPPSGIVTQPDFWVPVSAVTDAQPKYEAVVIDCGGEEVARITDIPEYPEIETGPAPVVPDENKS
jgi:hypothetical protein